jgi:hypothetical protein
MHVRVAEAAARDGVAAHADARDGPHGVEDLEQQALGKKTQANQARPRETARSVRNRGTRRRWRPNNVQHQPHERDQTRYQHKPTQ